MSDSDDRHDEMEMKRLEKAVSDVETVLANSGAEKRPVLENFLQNAKTRLSALEKKVKEAQLEREARSQGDATIAHMVDRERALNASEKESYAEFLEKEFFTKKDFNKLEQFYSNTWDRLTEGGKDEMSHRIWEGIRRDEYKFTELPKVVQEKETDRAYSVLKNGRDEAISRIPSGDRDDFLDAYEAGKRGEAAKILNRASFRDAMFLTAPSKERHGVDVVTGKDDLKERAQENAGMAPNTSKTQESDLDVTGIDLADANKPGEVAASNPTQLPKTTSTATRGEQSVRSC